MTLFEKQDRLGGNLVYAAGPPFKGDLKRYLQWLVDHTEQADGITVKLNCEATVDAVKAEQPDVVIVAAGSEPVIPEIPGAEKNNVIWVGDVHLNKPVPGEKVVTPAAA